MTRPAARLERILGDRRTFVTLIVLNVLVAVGIMWASRATILSDTWSYLALAEGILHGEYSMWWQLDQDYPDTFRTPGYPLLIAFMITVFGTWKSTLILQFILYWLALYFTLRTMARFDVRRSVQSLFLLLLLPMVNMPYYISQLYTEVPVLAAIAGALFLGTGPNRHNWKTSVALGLLFGFMFQCKPVFLLFPLFYAAAALAFDRHRVARLGNGLMLVTFACTVLPFAFWNLRNHGVFKATTLESAGSYMHIGYWGGKIPGYTDRFYLHNFMGDEVVRFVPENEIPGYIADYEQEWTGFNEVLDPLLTPKDTIMWEAAKTREHAVERTHNTAYTLKREELLFRSTMDHYWSDPWYVFKYKLYSAIRLWVIGVQKGEFQKASTDGKVQMIYATVSTAVVFLLALIVLPLAYRRTFLSLRTTWPFLVYIVYFGVMHVPFTIQARYTTSVRFVLFALMALAIGGLLWGKREKGSDGSITTDA